MKRLFLILFCLMIWGCKNSTGPSGTTTTSSSTTTTSIAPTANVVMTEGPVFVDGSSIFEYKGIVKNIGNATANWVKVYVYIRRSDSTLINFEYTYADPYTIAPGATAPWDVYFSDSNRAIRNAMDRTKTTYEIHWD